MICLLVIPAIAIEDLGPVEAMKRSAHIFKEHWVGR